MSKLEVFSPAPLCAIFDAAQVDDDESLLISLARLALLFDLSRCQHAR